MSDYFDGTEGGISAADLATVAAELRIRHRDDVSAVVVDKAIGAIANLRKRLAEAERLVPKSRDAIGNAVITNSKHPFEGSIIHAARALVGDADYITSDGRDCGLVSAKKLGVLARLVECAGDGGRGR